MQVLFIPIFYQFYSTCAASETSGGETLVRKRSPGTVGRQEPLASMQSRDWPGANRSRLSIDVLRATCAIEDTSTVILLCPRIPLSQERVVDLQQSLVAPCLLMT